MRATMSRLGRAAAASAAAALVTLGAVESHAEWILNTASVQFDRGSATSNVDSLWTLPSPTPSIVRFHQYAPGAPGATQTLADGGECADPAGDFHPLPPLRTVNGLPLDTRSPVPLLPAEIFHAGEPVFVTLFDPNRNEVATERETIELHITTTTGDEERLRLLETGPATGLFAAGIQCTGIPPPVVRFDCQLSVTVDTDLAADYTDPAYPMDTAHDGALVDPFGFVFISTTGALVGGVEITILDAVTGQPAIVFGDDGTSRFPSTVTTGGSAVDAANRVYDFPEGGFRFPYVAPGRYRFTITPPTEFVAPSRAPLAHLQSLRDPRGEPYFVQSDASFMSDFMLPMGPAFRVDIPLDPLASELILQKAVSSTDAAIGDFLQYELTLSNPTAGNANRIVLTDVLPAGFRYEPGSLRVNSQPAAEPVVEGDGRSFSVTIGDVPPGGTLNVSYLVHVTSGAVIGDAVNRARVTADGGIESNVASAAVRVRDELSRSRATIVGRVVAGDCGAPASNQRGVARVRILLEDGTFTATDADGQYHFEGVRAGTHVVQLDVTSLPAGFEPASCFANSRFAGSDFSQFVELQGGTLWRADFHLRSKPQAVANPVELRLAVEPHAMPPPEPPKPRVKQYTLNIKFDTALATLRPDARGPLDTLVATLKRDEIQSIRVIAHTDSVRIAPRYRHVFADNYKLSEGRAATVAAFLASGLSLSPEMIFTSGWGPDEPVASNATPEGRQKNRRVEVLVFERAGFTESKATSSPVYDFVVDVAAESSGVRNLSVIVELPVGLRFIPESNDAACDVADMWNQVLTFPVGDLEGGGSRRLRFQAEVDPRTGALPAGTSAADLGVTALARFEARDANGKPVALSTAATASGGGGSLPASVEDPVVSQTSPATQGADPTTKRAAIADDATANGAGVDWFAGDETGLAWLFPPADHNPRLPSVRIAIQHEPSQRLELRLGDRAIDGLHFEGTRRSADSTRAVSIWSGIDLEPGANRFTAAVFDRAGKELKQLERRVHYSGAPVSAEVALEECRLIADGIDKPVLAVRFIDRDGRPVHAGVTGPYLVRPPYEAAERIEFETRRALAGLDRFQPMYRVESDDGIAYIELAPTTESGEAVVELRFETSTRPLELRAWLEAPPRDWVLVGFAAGTLGYNTLTGDARALDEQQVDDDAFADGELRVYAKGRVPGRCLLTLALDLDDARPRGRTGPADDRRANLRGSIDPDAFYTLYGDGTTQHSDAPSQERVYLKLERSQFYALFGDYDTGMTVTELTRYSRSLNGFKSVYGGRRVETTAFASHTAQHGRRDEIQGNGTSGLYFLSRRDLVIGSDKVRLQTRDRFVSEKILTTRDLVRHIDYDIDPIAGTLLFRQPVESRDFAFNPIFIIAEYETQDASERDWNAGGRTALRLWNDRLTTGAAWIRESDTGGVTNLGGVDAKLDLGGGNELRLEAARSEGRHELGDADGDAYFAEITHRGARMEAALYSRVQDVGFGVRQQNGSEIGMRKLGGEAHLRWDDNLFADGQAFHQKNIATSTTRDVANAQVRYQTEAQGWAAGLQYAVDQTAAGRKFASRQVTLGANRAFLQRRLEMEGRGEIGIGDNDNLDFPTRLALQAGWRVSDQVKLLLAEEYAQGAAFDAVTTRFGAEVDPWKGARLNGTLNQNFGEHGPRTFGVLGLTQALLLGERWGVSASIDQSHTFSEAATPPPVFNSAQPLASGDLRGDYTAVSAGATYRAPRWSWNGRAEVRAGELDDQLGLTTAFLRQVQEGVAFSMSGRVFDTERASGENSSRADLDFSWAHRPLGDHWSWLERLRFEHLSTEGGLTPDVRSRRVVNNLSVNRVTGAWVARDRGGDPFDLEQRAQFSLHYGCKYVMSKFDDQDRSGYTDLVGVEARHDLSPHFDLGVHAGMLHSWHASNYQYRFGPSVGWSPFDNAWVSLGYNFQGFRDRDFDAARYSHRGPFVRLRFKFDQATRLGSTAPAAPPAPDARRAGSPQ
jgi:uncharacterized repeat protein (TIGR01451 family)